MEFRTHFNLVSDNESEHENEEEEWEAQQIRKGVTGAQVKTVQQTPRCKKIKSFHTKKSSDIQIAAAQQDSMLQQQYTMGVNVNQMIGSGVSLEMVLMPAPPPPPSIQPPDPTKIVPLTPQEVVDRMRARFYIFHIKLTYILGFKLKEKNRVYKISLYLETTLLLLKGWTV